MRGIIKTTLHILFIIDLIKVFTTLEFIAFAHHNKSIDWTAVKQWYSK